MAYKTPEERAAYAREWRRLHPEAARAHDKKKREKNPAAAAERMRAWRAANPEKAREQTRRSQANLMADPERRAKRKEYTKNYQDENREQRRKTWREWGARKRLEDPHFDRDRSWKQLYDLTPEQYEAMHIAQNGLCAICETDKPGNHRHKYFSVDHCHGTTKVRALLCHACNTGLGAFQDDPERLEQAAAYLRSHAPPLSTP